MFPVLGGWAVFAGIVVTATIATVYAISQARPANREATTSEGLKKSSLQVG